ncbi:tail protein X [Methylobacterium sp. J-070]|uniref:tail protein X n=1 Tax=Methylobacterium sp. J-070 TaxID=2836650 RepID=UPI001FBA062A|nr:tail protein X [Methylobacterium sp. J-070]MCJ2054267.1 tail protein X [Methylobacterium sp. J-070]
MTTIRRTVPEEIRLDRAAKRYLGTEQGGSVEAILALNPGLAAEGGWVPAGYELVLPVPDPDAVPVLPSIDPWA